MVYSWAIVQESSAQCVVYIFLDISKRAFKHMYIHISHPMYYIVAAMEKCSLYAFDRGVVQLYGALFVRFVALWRET